jgi:hypothetical protein
MAATAAPSFAAPRKAMVSPLVDLACIGGLSILVCGALLLVGPVPFDKHVSTLLPYALTVGITWPHFLASYRLLYATRESILTYRTASIYFPAALAAYGVFAVVVSQAQPVHLHMLEIGAGVYLARHYTGQTWGMMASFSHIAGVPFAARERNACLWALRLIMGWHMTWAMARLIGRVAPSIEPLAQRVDAHIDVVGYLSFAIAVLALGAMARRIGSAPPLRVVVPLLALYGWYALLRKDPSAIVVVQAAHALQYLIFPLRIEETRRAGAATPITPRRALGWAAALMAVGLALFAGIPALLRLSYFNAGGAGDMSAAFLTVFVSFVNIHHYFVDGCLYKLRNPAVRRDLFAHLSPPH